MYISISKAAISIAASLAMMLIIGCGGASRSSVPIVDVNTLDETTDVAVDAGFTYTFDDYMDTNSVDEATFFIVENEDADAAIEVDVEKDAYNSDLCNPDNGVPAKVENAILKAFVLYVTDDLSHDTHYAICITPDARLFQGESFEGFTAYFITESLD